MKTIKQIFLIILLCASYNTVTLSQNLDSMSIAKRDSLLIAIAKEVVLKNGPDYYREYSKPIIERSMVPPQGDINPTGVNAGRVTYRITVLYDKTEERLEMDYAAQVSIWADTQHPGVAMFGTGYGRLIPEGIDWRNDTTIEPMPYQESIIPLYNINNPDPNQEPVNKDVLIRKGFEKRSDGEWVRTRPDTPPAEALKVIERAKEEMRREIENR